VPERPFSDININAGFNGDVMCDYSLHGIGNRLAVEGEELFVHRFRTGSKGLASVSDLTASRPQATIRRRTGVWSKIGRWLGASAALLAYTEPPSLPAVCIPPGARLLLENDRTLIEGSHNSRRCGEATFTQLNVEPYKYRDAVCFDDGAPVLLQRLREGTRVRVLSLTLAEDEPAIISDNNRAVVRSLY
jgi:hypothetical protein